MAKDIVKRSMPQMHEGVTRPREEKRINVGFRVTPTLRKMLENAASKNGRSLSQEMEFRLERTFYDEGGAKDALRLAYGPSTFAVGLKFMDTIRTRQTLRDLHKRRLLDDEGLKLADALYEKHMRELIERDPGLLEEVQ